MQTIRWEVMIVCLLLVQLSTAQNTLGLLSYDFSESVGGYTLIYPDRQSTTYLLDECGQVVHRWEDDAIARPGPVAYLLPDGRLLRAKLFGPLFTEPSFGAGGAGGVIELVSWDNEVEWTYVVADTFQRQHHDVHYMPNGNILILAYDRYFTEDIVRNGFDTVSYSQRALWSEKVMEVDPLTDSIVWEWRLWDHLVQDYDSTQLNYGVVAESPGKVNINYQEYTFTRDDWIHANSLDYNEELDQIMISARNMNEIWIIDHSTTTAEAATSNGGNSGRGGELLWRWGSPHAYDQGTLDEQLLFSSHDAQWIDDFVDLGYEYYGQVAIFNNFIDYVPVDGRSYGQIISPVWDEETQSYAMANDRFLPTDFSETIVHPDTAKNFSTAASSIQIIEDGHVIMTAGRQGRTFELDETGEVVWEYLTPLRNGQAMPQGLTLNLSDNFTFRSSRYPRDYAAFTDRDLTPQGYLETNPNEAFCSVVTTAEVPGTANFRVFPNPTADAFFVDVPVGYPATQLRIFDQLGRLQRELAVSGPSRVVIDGLAPGLYLLRMAADGRVVRLIVR
ncbi:MAG: aryl-sulfate sulfotransferase [Bacteroidota bacterium]